MDSCGCRMLPIVMATFLTLSQALVHSNTPSMVFTQQSSMNDVQIVTVNGDPDVWVRRKTVERSYVGKVITGVGTHRPHRVALGYQFNTKGLFYSDIGLKQVYRGQLMAEGDFNGAIRHDYNLTAKSLYTGTSAEVLGLAVDWVAGTVYWTDALYNWITVADANNYDVYRHIVTSDIDQPIGIAVHPHKGYVFWSDRGAIPRVERCRADGSERLVLVGSGLSRPAGVTIDYTMDHLYWVDDGLDTIERSDYDGNFRYTFRVAGPNMPTPAPSSRGYAHHLFGIAVYHDHIFVTDQLSHTIDVFNKHTENLVYKFNVTGGIPYDVMIYDGEQQKPMPSSQCYNLSCEHICVNLGGGAAKCLCKQGFNLNPDGRTCNDTTFTTGEYVYSVGNQLCKVHVSVSDKVPVSLVQNHMTCHVTGNHQIEALAADVDARYVFFSDSKSGAIFRVRWENGLEMTEIALQSGSVKGITVDWVASNLYWTNKVKGQVMVSRLDGSYPRIVIQGLEKPTAIVADPAHSMLYWVDGPRIYRSLMDGSMKQNFVVTDLHSPEGMVIDQHRQRLYWADSGLPGLDSISLNGTDRRTIYTNNQQGFRGVTVYQDYVAWTDGDSSTYFGVQLAGEDRIKNLNEILHVLSNATGDIITFDSYVQPAIEGPCDNDNGGCEHLCLPRQDGRICACAVGFVSRGEVGCWSDLQSDNFLLFVDPHHKQTYQISLDSPLETGAHVVPRGFALEGALSPRLVAYNLRVGEVFWLDEGAGVIQRKQYHHQARQQAIYTITQGELFGGLVYSSMSDLLIMSVTDDAIYAMRRDGADQHLLHKGLIIPGTLAVNNIDGTLWWCESVRLSTPAVYRMDSGSASAMQVTNSIPSDVIGLTVDEENGEVYVWTPSAVWSLVGHDSRQVALPDPGVALQTVAVDSRTIYYNALGAIFSYNNATAATTQLTDELFSSVADMKVIRADFTIPTWTGLPTRIVHTPVVPQQTPTSTVTISTSTSSSTSSSTPTVSNSVSNSPVDSVDGGDSDRAGQGLPSTKHVEKNNMILIIACCVGVAVVVVVVIVVVIVVVRRKQNATKSPQAAPSVTYEPKAHENLTYMSCGEVNAMCARIDTGNAQAAPPIDDYPTKDGAPADLGFEAESEAEACASVVGSVTDRDNATLVGNMAEMAEYAEVKLDMDMGTPPPPRARTADTIDL